MEQQQQRLLPKASVQEFASREYWDNFFVQQQQQQQTKKKSGVGFEWYGDWVDIRPIVRAHRGAVSNEDGEVLVIGCGNSSLSRDVHGDDEVDLGKKKRRNVVSIDFSPVVIAEMKKQQEEEKDGSLQYLLMDMLNLEKSWTGKFDVVMDKGALDALMTEESEQVREQGTKMLGEVDRVLRKDGTGRYVCVSLLQDHILDHLIESAFLNKWRLDIHPFYPRAGSPHCPFVIVATKLAESSSIDWRVHPVLRDQKEMETALRAPVKTTQKAVPWTSEWKAATKDMTYALVKEAQHNFLIQVSLRENGKGIRGRFEIGGEKEKSLRFEISVLDSGLSSKDVKVPMAVFIVPRGREKEWVFTSEQSRMEIATNNKIGRLVVVVQVGAKSAPTKMKEIQDELSRSMLQLAPRSLPQGFSIPYMTVESSGDEDIKERVVVEQGTSQLSGDYMVEDVLQVEESETPPKSSWRRRLIFLSNSTSVQSECLLLDENIPSSSSKKKNKKKKKKKSKAAKAQSTETTKAESEPDSKSASASAATIETVVRKKVAVILDSSDEEDEQEAAIVTKTTEQVVKENHFRKPDLSRLAFEFHRVMLAGLSLGARVSEQGSNYLVVGLGGGMLVSHLAKRREEKPTSIDAIELDPEMVEIARKYFGFDSNGKVTVHVLDGIKFMLDRNNGTGAEERLYDAILLDVDAKDPASPVVSPPLPFLEKGLLEHIRDKLLVKESGMLVFNLACRAPAITKEMIGMIKSVFPKLYTVSFQDAGLVNQVIFAKNFNFGASAAQKEPNSKQKAKEVEALKKTCREAIIAAEPSSVEEKPSQEGSKQKKGKLPKETTELLDLFDSLQII